METIKRRSEVLFLYDCSYTNPNGDPVDENKPRIDEETGINLVTDVRIKRTIRDYLYDVMGEEIFVREIANEEGKIQDGKARAEDFLVNERGEKLSKGELKNIDKRNYIRQAVLTQCIDVRLFGSTIPLEGDSITLTGPVQFKMGRSLHRVKLEYLKGTGAFASGSDQTRKTFREEYVLPYSLIAAHAVINENAAVHTGLTAEDVEKMLEALWKGTKDLHSRSKVGQMPRLLVQVEYNQPHYHLGELDKEIVLKSDKLDEELRDVSDYTLDFARWLERIGAQKQKIGQVRLAQNGRLQVEQDLASAFSTMDIPVHVWEW